MNTYILTRFNIPIHYQVGKNKEKAISWIDNIEYLEKRFELFEKYTFPSIVGQVYQEFEWIVMFYKHTPDCFKNRLDNYKKYKNFKVIYIDDNDNYISKLQDYIGVENEFITIRIDNDDAISKNYINELLSQKLQSNTIYSFPKGIQYHNKHSIGCLYDYNYNHYIALTDGIVIEYNHTKVSQNFPVIMLEYENPMWIEVIHCSNVSNQWRPQWKNVWKKPIDLKGNFTLDESVFRKFSKNRKNNILYRGKLLLSWTFSIFQRLKYRTWSRL